MLFASRKRFIWLTVSAFWHRSLPARSQKARLLTRTNRGASLFVLLMALIEKMLCDRELFWFSLVAPICWQRRPTMRSRWASSGDVTKNHRRPSREKEPMNTKQPRTRTKTKYVPLMKTLPFLSVRRSKGILRIAFVPTLVENMQVDGAVFVAIEATLGSKRS